MLCFYILLVKIEKKSYLNCLFLKYNGVTSFFVLKNIQIDILYMFLCSLFQNLCWNKYYLGNMATILDLVIFYRFKELEKNAE